MKKVAVFLILVVSILLIGQGCSKDTEQPIKIIKEPTQPEQEEQPEGQTETGQPQGTTGTTKTQETQKCDYRYEVQDIKKIGLSMVKSGKLEKTEEGFSFRVIPQIDNGSIVAADGFVTVKIYATKFDLGKRTTDYEVYRSVFKVSDENVAVDCSSEKITVLFADIKSSPNYKFVKEGDPGIMFVEFRSGVGLPQESKYEPEKYGESILR